MRQNHFKFTIPFILILAFLSCETDTSNTETVDVEDFLPQSKKEYNYEVDTIRQVEENVPDSLQRFVESKISNAVFRSTTALTNTKYFPDRLDHNQRFYHEITIDSTLYELIVWEFEDSLQTVNAFYNWMDCFGKKCKSIRIGDSKWIYDGSMQLFVDDAKLIYVACKGNMNKKLWSDLFEPTFKDTWNYHLYQPLKRKVQWINLTAE